MIKKSYLKQLALGFAVVLAFAVQGFSQTCTNSSGQNVFCQWGASGNSPGGCYPIDPRYSTPVGAPCADLIANCDRDGLLYTGVTGTLPNNGDGAQCTQYGGQLVGGRTSCYFPNGQQAFCQQPSGCFELFDRVDNPRTCEVVINQCRNSNGLLFSGVSSSMPNSGTGQQCANHGGQRYDPRQYCYDIYKGTCEEILPTSTTVPNEWECIKMGGNVQLSCTPPTMYCHWVGWKCDQIPGPDAATVMACVNNLGDPVTTCPQSVSPSARSRSASAPLSAYHVKGGISVSWNAGLQISGGTITLVNIKGETVASTPVKAGGGNVSATLGLKSTLPAGMYFVRVNARDVSGRQIVRQVPVSVMK